MNNHHHDRPLGWARHTSRVFLRVATVLLLVISPGPPANADVAPATEALQINQATTLGAPTPDVAPLGDSGFLVVWDHSSVNNPSLLTPAWGRAFDADGQALGDEFLVASYTSHKQAAPRLARREDGSFVVVWTALYYGGYRINTEIFARILGSNGTPQSSAFRVTAALGTDEGGSGAAVAGLPGNAFVVVWDDVFGAIKGQRFDSSGAPAGTEIPIASTVPGFPSSEASLPTLSANPNGDFLVVWKREALGSPQSTDVAARAFDVAGMPLGDEFQVNTYTTGAQGGHSSPQLVPRLARTSKISDGGFVVVWHDLERGGTYGRRISASSLPTGSEFPVAEGGDTYLELAMTADDTMLVAEGTTGSIVDIGGQEICSAVDLSEVIQAPIALAPLAATFTDAGRLVVVGQFADAEDVNVNAQIFEFGRPCGDPAPITVAAGSAGSGTLVTATDALFILSAAVGGESCELCVCDVDGSGMITATDALADLLIAVGLPGELQCPPCT